MSPIEALAKGLCLDGRDRYSPCPEGQLFIEHAEFPLGEAFGRDDYGGLDRLYAQWVTGKERFPDGRWKLSWFDRTLFDTFSYGRWAASLTSLRRWQKDRPDSVAARLAEATYWRAYAWHARGNGYARTVSKEAWALYRERLDYSREVLESLPRDCPPRYALLINTLAELGSSEAELLRHYREGIARFPQYHPIYFAMARQYEPRWGGSPEAYERFATEVAAATREFEGQGMYARLYWLVDYDGGLPLQQRGGRLPPEWTKLRAAYEDLMRHYPTSEHNLGQYLNVACRSPDSALYHRLRKKLPDTYLPYVKLNESIEVCDQRHKYVVRRS